MSRAPEPAAGRPSALAAPFVPSAARRALRRPAPGGGSRFAASFGGGGGGGGVAAYGGAGAYGAAGAGAAAAGSGGLGASAQYPARRAARSPPPPAGGSASVYASGGLRERARADAALLLRGAGAGSGVPAHVHRYYALLPVELDALRAVQPLAAGGALQPYKALSTADGAPALLVRVPGRAAAASAQVVRAAEAWRRVRHAGVVPLAEVFSTRAFAAADVNEVVFAYAFPGHADSLAALFLAGGARAPLPEDALWALATQLLSAVAACHARGLAARDALDPAAVVVVGRNRVALLGVGIADAFDPAGADHIPAHGPAPNVAAAIALLQADLGALAALLLALALRANPAVVRGGALAVGVAGALDVLRATPSYSQDFTRLAETLVAGSARGARVTIREALAVAAPRLAAELGNVWTHADGLQRALAAEFDASRMFRLMALLGFVNERDGAGVGDNWSETGDRYLLKLFRDYVFHRVTPAGNPQIDLAHVVESLAKLDAGAPEQVLLASRNNAALIVASYEDLRRCLMNAVDELLAPRLAPR